MSRLADIKARLDAATPGPWLADTEQHTIIVEDTAATVVCAESGTPYGVVGADADLIAHAPDDLRYLLDRVREAERMLKTAWGAGEDIADVRNWLESLQ